MVLDVSGEDFSPVNKCGRVERTADGLVGLCDVAVVEVAHQAGDVPETQIVHLGCPGVESGATGTLERRAKCQVLHRVPIEDKLGEDHEVGTARLRLPQGVGHELRVGTEIPHGRVELGHCHAQRDLALRGTHRVRVVRRA